MTVLMPIFAGKVPPAGVTVPHHAGMMRIPVFRTSPGTVGRASRAPVPALPGLADYSVAFTLPVQGADAHDARTWARAVFAGAPAPLRPVLILGWRVGLGLRLGPARSAEHVLGWRVVENRPELVVLTAASPLVEATNIALVDRSGLTWTTAVRYRRAAGRFVWGAAAPVHEQTLPHLLTRAARSLTG
jgi:hypothetical protein